MTQGDTDGAGESAAGPLDTETTPQPDWISELKVPAQAVPESVPTAATPTVADSALPAATPSVADSALTAATPAVPETAPRAEPAAPTREPKRRILPRWVLGTTVFAAFIAGGIAVTWPRVTYLTGGKLLLDPDQSQYVWNFWWVARQVTHLGNPWFTNYLAAPAGVQLGYDTLSPLLGIVMTPVTLLLGPSVSYNLVAILIPGLAAYTLYRAARLWLPSRIGAIAAGAFYGYSSMLTSQVWLHLHTAMGCVFLPLTLEAAVRLRRRPGTVSGIVLGVVVGAAILVDQEVALLAIIVAVLALLPWLLGHLNRRSFWAAGVGAVSAVVVASPQLLAIMRAGGRGGPATVLAGSYMRYAARLPDLFAPSPHLASYGLSGLASVYGTRLTAGKYASHAHELAATFGVVLTITALGGLVAAWRRRPGARRLALLWLGSAILALGPALNVMRHTFMPLATTWHGIRVSLLMPYTWFVRIPVLSSFREADRLALLGLVAAALLAGAAVDWLWGNRRPLIIIVAVLAALEAGWSGVQGDRTVPSALPALDRPIAADHSGSVVVDVPFLVSGPTKFGTALSPYALNLATADGHPRAVSYTSGVPGRTIAAIRAQAFYSVLVDAEKGRTLTPRQLDSARQDLRTLHIGWVLIWLPNWVPSFPLERIGPALPNDEDRHVMRYLDATGFRFDYQADNVLVYRPAG